MSAAASISWPNVLSQLSASLGEMQDLPPSEILDLPRSLDIGNHKIAVSDVADKGLNPTSDGTIIAESQQTNLKSLDKKLPNVADWKGTLDLITGMSGMAQDLRSHLQEQAGAHEYALEEVRRELSEAQQRLRASRIRADALQAQADTRLREVQVNIDAQVQNVLVEVEARVHVIQAESDDRVRAVEKRVIAADQRAKLAEHWLRRIDTATKNLLLGGHMNWSER